MAWLYVSQDVMNAVKNGTKFTIPLSKTKHTFLVPYYVTHGAISIVRICTLMMNSPFMSGRILCVLQDFVAQVAGRRIQYHQSYHELSRRVSDKGHFT